MRLFALLALPAIAGAAPVFAQQAMTGSRLPGPPVAGLSSSGALPGKVLDRNSDHAVATGRAMAQCMLDQSSKRSLAIVDAASADERQKAADSASSIMSFCLGRLAATDTVALHLSSASLAGVIAETWLRTNKPAVPEALPMRKNFSVAWESDDSDQKIIDEMAVCLAATHPQETSGLVLSEPGSTDEQAAFARIVPLLGPCLVKNATLKTDRDGVRFALATALYHRDHDAPTSLAANSTGKN